MLLSIIVPVYGVENYIEDCIQSCVENIKDCSSEVEVVVVDDGSKDRSIEIVRRLTSDLPYFHIIVQENQGLSLARNNGLLSSTGDYVWFVDSDDFISIGIVKEILDAIHQRKDVDVFELKYEMTNELSTWSSKPKIEPSENNYTVLSGRNRVLMGFNTPVPFHVFRRSFLFEKNLRMYPGIYHEDSEFTPRVLWQANLTMMLPNVAYYYRRRNNSIMTTSNPKKGEDYIFVAHRLQDFFDGQDMGKDERRIVNDYVAMTFCNGLHNVIGANSESRNRVERAAYEHRSVLLSLRGAKQMKYRVLGLLGSIYPYGIVRLYSYLMFFNRK